jgi:hypothetical protein
MSQTAAAATGECPRQRVTVSVVDGRIRVDPEPFAISKNNQEEVIWQASDSKVCFTVEFDRGDSPFYEFQFSNDFPASGLVRRSVLADPQRKYKYTVRVEGVKDPLDPSGVITK